MGRPSLRTCARAALNVAALLLLLACGSSTVIKVKGPTLPTPTPTPDLSPFTVYVGSFDTNVYALRASDGTLLWKYQTGGKVFSSPIVGS